MSTLCHFFAVLRAKAGRARELAMAVRRPRPRMTYPARRRHLQTCGQLRGNPREVRCHRPHTSCISSLPHIPTRTPSCSVEKPDAGVRGGPSLLHFFGCTARA
ncbi:uncharacterized protein CC84DRAFT_518691 [Paraphaeosphaeria sporulosa]|uniref:Uncharacterized protein n=1 Tax=Paraphaeosphaeria sporulosa TaxID=1460663 RepID=A0A177CV41_9PLEO|nr:uncharacterized protein CC84DRAFT_518691 [Paraphaeosphaeria sporulosa]OAG11081.1 hypothetical protein CC84DRAFT_518691 [Paraphaeosphaeria sporulosa]